ncbi:MAG: PEP-CTERM sorting domain-containing protein [Pirellulales bacterium]
MKNDTRDTSKSQQSATKRRIAYSLAAGAAACAAGENASAAVVYSGLQNIDIAPFNAVNLDLDNYLGGDVKLKNYVFGGGAYQGASVNYAPGKLVLSNTTFPFYVSALAPGASINSAALGTSFYGSMAYGGVNPNAEFKNVDNGILGLSFPAGSFGTFFGWVRVDINNAAGSFVIKDWAYDDANAAILAGDTGGGFVPEPGTLGLLAAGSAGVLAMRRRKSAA